MLKLRLPLGAGLCFLALVTFDAPAQQQPAGSVQTPSGQPARPRDSTVNLPSDTGSQTTTPAGAATGAGQPQGMTRQPDVGSAGGLEKRARTRERAEWPNAESRAASERAGTGVTEDRARTRPRPARASKG